ncbi:MAG: dihydrodipicolinate synthase family protein [Bryobacteraceae bacterium]|nr:dihydrodipicolinate synthase family protein [Bryobacteraceae bacterium]
MPINDPHSTVNSTFPTAPISGVWAAVVTPRRETGHEIDIAATLDILDFLNDSPVTGLSILGSTGEFVHFDYEQRVNLMRFALKRSQKPVLPNITHSSLDGTVGLAEQALDLGAAGLLAMPPYYFRYSPADVRRYYLELSDALEGAPLFLYNIPFFSTPLPIDLACELLATGRFAGIKDSSGDSAYYQRLLTLRATHAFSLIIGNDAVFGEARLAGADGVVSGVAGAWPELICAMERAAQARDTAAVARLDVLLQEVITWLDKFPVPVALKRAVSRRGLPEGNYAVPPGSFAEFDAWCADFLPRMLAATK